ncbi:GNAT family N-acetyltransferase [Sediminitomix flava]|uniref:Ribosomal protein S18 acetylase RimI-like enzyme n=1 Tax=Sediminitomix flava TaxID=379075 RepID=A0A315Z5R9_SEDFL|nr:GNAT family N-acetyltransferase [Sediminitomix flava]PWJ38549.1 ribosomal protein S18 acetylase RimI-like enzyme [Sediminitomix flava]
MEYKFLNQVSIETVQQCMQDSFADYELDMSYMTVDVMKHRNTICRNAPECSVGAFDNGKMVGFLNVGIDYLNDELVAFDGGTGVVKAFRGKGIAGKMFEKSLLSIKEKGIHSFYLEVLQSNEAAIKAYEKEGFRIVQNFKCYNISVSDFKGKINELDNLAIKSIPLEEIGKYWHFITKPVSWEHMFSGLQAVEKDLNIYAAFHNHDCIGFIVYSKVLCWITAIGIHPNYTNQKVLVEQLLGKLFSTIQPSRPKISLNNLEEADQLNDIIVSLGFENTVDQYEMMTSI